MSSYTEGQVHQLADAFEVVGFTKAHLTRLGQAPAILENLLKVLDGKATFNISLAMGWKLYLHPSQGGRTIKGFELEAHLKETGRLDRAYGLDDDLVKGWIANPATFPEDFKGKAIFLWKSAQDRFGFRYVPYLVWFGGKVLVLWLWVEDGWSDDGPALLAS